MNVAAAGDKVNINIGKQKQLGKDNNMYGTVTPSFALTTALITLQWKVNSEGWMATVDCSAACHTVRQDVSHYKFSLISEHLSRASNPAPNQPRLSQQ